MAQLVLVVVVAASGGLIGYSEAVRVEQRFNEGPWGLSAPICGVACFATALVGGYLAMPVVFAAEAGIIGHHDATNYERLYRNQLFRKPAWTWGILSGVFAFVGVLLTSTITWGIVCVTATLICALALVSVERDQLIAACETLVSEKNALLGEKKTWGAERAQLEAMAKPHRQTHSHAIAAALRAEKDAGSRVPPIATKSSVVSVRQSESRASKMRADAGSDLLPRRTQRVTPRNGDIESGDLIPNRRG